MDSTLFFYAIAFGVGAGLGLFTPFLFLALVATRLRNMEMKERDARLKKASAQFQSSLDELFRKPIGEVERVTRRKGVLIVKGRKYEKHPRNKKGRFVSKKKTSNRK